MQTVLILTSRAAGAIYLNGRWAGEVHAQQPLTLPVAPQGAFILEMRPFAPGLLPLTVHLTLSGGKLLPGCLQDDARLCAALWPGGAIELELLPEALPIIAPGRFIGLAGEARISFMEAGAGRPEPMLRCEWPGGTYAHPCPEGAQLPTLSLMGGNLLLRGERKDGGQYALVLSPDGRDCALTLQGRAITPLEESASLRVLRELHDTVGHARLETWAPTPGGWQCVSLEPMWADGAPAWPRTPEKTALAAIEAALLGLMDEMNGYLAPTADCAAALERLREYDGCTPLRQALPGGGDAVGLMRMEQGLLRIVPVHYHAAPGGAQGGWQLDALKIDA